jgi:RimJ/RimL family protein N-acetyltransferase
MLAGRHVRLEPLRSEHAAALGRAAQDGALWNLAYTTVPHPDQAQAYVDAALSMQAAGQALPFVVLDARGDVVGSTRFYHIDPAVPRLTIGYTWYAARAQRTALNTEAKRLQLAHAFEAMGCEAVTFETSHLNLRSQEAIERLGARRDGVLRAHLRHRDGSLRDTHVFSILANEWPTVRARLDSRLEQAA